MAERSPNKMALTHDEILELIPWYVNGSLSEAEAEIVERYSAENDECRIEIEQQSGIAAGVCLLDPLEADAETKARSWEQLSAQIAAEERAQSPVREQRSWFPSFLSMTAMAGTLAAVVLVAVVFLPPEDGEFRTLTSDGHTNGEVIKFQLAPGTGRDALQEVLAGHGLTLVGEPSADGVYRAAASAGADLETTADALMSAPEVLFAAPEGQP